MDIRKNNLRDDMSYIREVLELFVEVGRLPSGYRKGSFFDSDLALDRSGDVIGVYKPVNPEEKRR